MIMATEWLVHCDICDAEDTSGMMTDSIAEAKKFLYARTVQERPDLISDIQEAEL